MINLPEKWFSSYKGNLPYQKYKNTTIEIFVNPTKKEMSSEVVNGARGYIDPYGNLFLEGSNNPSAYSEVIHADLLKILTSKNVPNELLKGDDFDNELLLNRADELGVCVQRAWISNDIYIAESYHSMDIKDSREELKTLLQRAKENNPLLNFHLKSIRASKIRKETVQYTLREAINYENYKDTIPKEDFEKIIELDPTKDKGYKYAVWLCGIYLKSKKANDTMYLAMISTYPLRTEIFTSLKEYDKIKDSKYMPIKFRNIMNFNSYIDLENFIERDAVDVIENVRIETARKQTNIIDETDSYVFVSPKSHASAIYWGEDTTWCTSAQDDSNHYNRYTGSGTIYIFRTKVDETTFYADPSGVGIQIYIPKDRNSVLAECRDMNDKTIYASRLFAIINMENKVNQHIRKLWAENCNTDQWEEGTGYLDPEVLNREEEDEEEENLFRWFNTFYQMRDGNIMGYASIDLQDSDYNVLDTPVILSVSGLYYTPEKRFWDNLGSRLLSTIAEEIRESPDEWTKVPNIFDNSFATVYTSTHSFGSAYNVVQNEGYDEDSAIVNIPDSTQFLIDKAEALIFVSYGSLILDEEPVYHKFSGATILEYDFIIDGRKYYFSIVYDKELNKSNIMDSPFIKEKLGIKESTQYKVRLAK